LKWISELKANQSLDLMDIEALGSFVTRITGELGGVDILGNISGSPPPTTGANVSSEQWIKEFRAMVVSIMHVTDLVLLWYAREVAGTCYHQHVIGSSRANTESRYLKHTAVGSHRMVENTGSRSSRRRDYGKCRDPRSNSDAQNSPARRDTGGQRRQDGRGDLNKAQLPSPSNVTVSRRSLPVSSSFWRAARHLVSSTPCCESMAE
jgi:hypothetical protein